MKAAVLSDTIYLKDRNSMRTVSKTSGVARKTGEAMTELLIIADDFTGALDTGVQFASRGVSTRVFAESAGDLAAAFAEVQVVVVNSETRHKTPAEAYETVFRLAAQARECGVPFLYKKTDSALRGNIGSELAAAMDAMGADKLVFAPAFPRMDRITRQGIQYVDGVPVAESVFGSDPFEPVRSSSVETILRETTDHGTFLHAAGDLTAEGTGIHVYDAVSDGDLERIAVGLRKEDLAVSAGCAAFASVLADRLGLGGSAVGAELSAPLLVLCGSRNPVTIRQMETAEKAGYPHIRLTREQKTDWSAGAEDNDRQTRSWVRLARDKGLCIVDANEIVPVELDRERVETQLGLAGKAILDGEPDCALMFTGGDTLLGVMRSTGIRELTPVGELFPGVVLTRMEYKGKTYSVVSKSGGFGGPDLLCRMAE